jgi:hypothetical protein
VSYIVVGHLSRDNLRRFDVGNLDVQVLISVLSNLDNAKLFAELAPLFNDDV